MSSFYPFIKQFHSGWAYVALLLLIMSAINCIIGWLSKKPFAPINRKIALFGLIGTHLQLLIGLLVYLVSPFGFASLGQMADKTLRLTSLEHPLINLVAVVFITIGWSKHKKAQTDELKFKSIGLFYGLGLLLILSRIPWSLWF